MARLARLVVPGLPHHVTQRGNRRQQTFFGEDDYAAYLQLMAEWCRERGVDVWAYCLMPNHVHLIAVPQAEDSLARAIGEAHRRSTRRISFREKWRGYLWQGRFASFVLDEPYLLAAARYVELNPLRAGLVADAADWRWSSAGPHLSRRDDRLVQTAPLLAMIADWRGFLDSDSGRRASRSQGAWPHRLSARQRHVCGTPGASRGPRSACGKTRPSAAQIAQTPIIGSCPRNTGIANCSNAHNRFVSPE